MIWLMPFKTCPNQEGNICNQISVSQYNIKRTIMQLKVEGIKCHFCFAWLDIYLTWYDGPLCTTKALFSANAIHQEHMKLDLLLVIFSFPLSLPIATLLLFLLPNFSKENLIFDNKHSNDNLKHRKRTIQAKYLQTLQKNLAKQVLRKLACIVIYIFLLFCFLQLVIKILRVALYPLSSVCLIWCYHQTNIKRICQDVRKQY